MATYIEDRDSRKMIVAAIDFGTTFSGYAFAFRNDYMYDALRIQGNTWASGSQIGVSLKTPTCVLFNPSGKFDSFGFDAEDKYAELAIDNNHHDWYYFRRFKMMLYNNPNISSKTNIEDDKGKLMNAMDVFSAIINYMRCHMLRAMHERSVSDGIDDDEVHWVLTVPAIWSDKAKQFMRKSAKKAGISSDHLDIALEPEAASIFCKHIPVNRRRQEQQEEEGTAGLEAIAPGVKYLVLDAGGGTIDITVQEVNSDGSISQVYMANGGDWGGTKVDEAYEEFLIQLVGIDVWERFKMEHRDAYLDIIREFEIKKRTITPDIDQKVTFKIPIALNEIYQETKGETLKSSVSYGKRGGKMAWIGDKLRVDASEAKRLFETTCEAIVTHVESIFEQEEASGTSVILMVGGFSESPMLRHAVKEKFGRTKRIIIPQDAGLSVLKGAVLFGFDTRIISNRISKHTYGIKVWSKFRDGKDPEDRKGTAKGKTYCSDRFHKHVNRKQTIAIGEETEEQDYWPLEDDQSQINFKVFITEKDDPEYCETDNCTFIGKLLVDLPMNVPEDDRGVSVKLRFGGTELSVEAKVKETGERTEAQFNLLE